MTAPDDAKTESDPQPSRLDALAVYFKPRVLIVLLLGFSSGLPLALCSSTLAVWLTERNVDIKTIGLFSLVGLPYTFKFVWAPLIDALDVPLLSRWFGRRRGWLVFTQLLLMAAIVALGLSDPDKSLTMIVIAAVVLATVSASQDTVIDAFRVESLPENEQAAGMAGYVAAYRIGMLVSGAGVLVLVAWLERSGTTPAAAWSWGYAAAAVCIVVGLIATMLAREPDAPDLPPHDAAHKPLKRLVETATGAFGEFLSRNGAVVILLFVVLYKFCDAFAGALTAAFIIKLGFDKATYAEVVKGVGLAAALIGGFAGGAIARALPMSASLWIGGFLQMFSNFTFSWLAVIGVSVPALTFTIIVENFTGAIGTVIFVAYLSALCGARTHTATQYALLTALASVGRTVLSSGGGFIADSTGWLLAWLQTHGHFTGMVVKKG
ncbi:MAG: MFS transporter [Pseudolabrys sp.]